MHGRKLYSLSQNTMFVVGVINVLTNEMSTMPKVQVLVGGSGIVACQLHS